MSAARVKRETDRRRHFAGLYRKARATALRDAEALVAKLRHGAPLRSIHFAAFNAHMSAGLLQGDAAWFAEAKERVTRARAGRRGPASWRSMGWPDAGEVYRARQRRESARAA